MPFQTAAELRDIIIVTDAKSWRPRQTGKRRPYSCMTLPKSWYPRMESSEVCYCDRRDQENVSIMFGTIHTGRPADCPAAGHALKLRGG